MLCSPDSFLLLCCCNVCFVYDCLLNVVCSATIWGMCYINKNWNCSGASTKPCFILLYLEYEFSRCNFTKMVAWASKLIHAFFWDQNPVPVKDWVIFVIFATSAELLEQNYSWLGESHSSIYLLQWFLSTARLTPQSASVVGGGRDVWYCTKHYFPCNRTVSKRLMIITLRSVGPLQVLIFSLIYF